MLLMQACYTPQEGCRDASAVNYDVKADINCCCIYPRAIVEFTYQYDTSDYRQSAIYTDVNGHPYQINGFQLNLHGLKLISMGGDTIDFMDSLNIKQKKNVIEKNIRAGHIVLKAELGLFNVNARYSELQFTLGVGEELKNYTLKDLKKDTEIMAVVKDVYASGRWYDGYLSYVPDTAKTDSIIRRYFTVPEVNVALEGHFIPQYGHNMSLPLRVDLHEVLDDFAVEADSVEQVKQISSGWKNAIRLDTL